MNAFSISRALFPQLCPCPRHGHYWGVSGHDCNFPVANVDFGGYRSPVAANSATGRENPWNVRRNSAPITIAGAFFVPAILCYGGCAWAGFGLAGFLTSRFLTPRTAATLSREKDGGSSSTLGAELMTTLTPSKIRALAHRRMALSALHANSSLFVRLKRYNHHMTIVRSLEAGGVQ